MAGYGDDGSSHGSVRRWGDHDDQERRRDREHRRHHREDRRSRFDMLKFIRMGPKPLVGGETPDVAENWLERMEACFGVFHCSEEQKMDALIFLLEGHAHKWWKSASASLLHEQGYVSWVDFRKAFRDLYFSPTLRRLKTLELLSLKQEDMTVEEYQQKFNNLLPFCPHINESSEAKYLHFLHGLNQEIYEMMSVCDNQTSYEGLVNQCRQAEHTIMRRKLLQTGRTSISLGPRGQSFKRSGTSSSSASGDCGKMKLQCEHCGRDHPTETCRAISGACFVCGSMEHLKRNCPHRGHQTLQGSASGLVGNTVRGISEN